MEHQIQPQAYQPSPEELQAAMQQINQEGAGVYRSANAEGAQAPELVRVDAHAGELATSGTAVGMAALPEQYADQQLNRFDFTKEQYAAARQEAQVRDFMRSVNEHSDEEEKDTADA